MNIQRINYQGGKNLKHASAFAKILQIEKIATIFNSYRFAYPIVMKLAHYIWIFFEGLYSQKIKTLKNFKIKNKENKISHRRQNSLRNKIEFQTY